MYAAVSTLQCTTIKKKKIVHRAHVRLNSRKKRTLKKKKIDLETVELDHEDLKEVDLCFLYRSLRIWSSKEYKG